MERSRDNHAINIFHIQQPPMIIQSLNSGSQLPGLVMTPRVDVGDGHQLGIRQFQNLLQQLLPTPTNTNHADTNAVVRSQHARRWIGQQRRRGQSRLLHKLTPAVVSHNYPQFIVVPTRALSLPKGTRRNLLFADSLCVPSRKPDSSSALACLVGMTNHLSFKYPLTTLA